MRLFDTPLQPMYFQHLALEDRRRILEAGAVAAEQCGVSDLHRYILPNFKVFACEEIRDGKIVLGEAKNYLFARHERKMVLPNERN